MDQWSNLKGHHDGFQYRICITTSLMWLLKQILCLSILHRGCLCKSGKQPHEMISKCPYVIGGGHIQYSTQSEQIRRCRTNKPTPLNSTDLCTTWGAMRWLNTHCLIVHVLRGSSIGYLATLVLLGSMHRLYMNFTQKIINNNYKLNWDS